MRARERGKRWRSRAAAAWVLALALLAAPGPPVASGQAPAAPEPATGETAVPEQTAQLTAESPLERRDRLRLGALAAAGLERLELATEAGRLVYWQGGAGRPLVLLHGSGDSAGTFAAVVPDLVADHRLLIPDLPGHGDSEPADGVLPMATIFGGLEALLDHADLASAAGRPPVLAGNSVGAWLAMIYAHRHPDRVSRVVAINGGAILGEPSEVKLMPADREEARASMAAIRDPSSPPIPDEVLDDIVARANSGPIRRMMMDLGGMMAWLLDGRLGEIDAPVDLLWGESDQLMKPSYAERMAAALPRARITLIPRCGHIPMGECPERFVALLRELLDGAPPPLAEPPPEASGDDSPGSPAPAPVQGASGRQPPGLGSDRG